MKVKVGNSFYPCCGNGHVLRASRAVVDYPAFRDLLKKTDFDGSAIVERDMYPARFDKPLPTARHNREYLREIGIG